MKLFVFISMIAVSLASVSKADTFTKSYKIISAHCYSGKFLEPKDVDCGAVPKELVVNAERPTWDDPQKVCLKTNSFNKCFVDERMKESRSGNIQTVITNTVTADRSEISWRRSVTTATMSGPRTFKENLQSFYIGRATDTGEMIYRTDEYDITDDGVIIQFEKGRIYHLEEIASLN